MPTTTNPQKGGDRGRGAFTFRRRPTWAWTTAFAGVPETATFAELLRLRARERPRDRDPRAEDGDSGTIIGSVLSLAAAAGVSDDPSSESPEAGLEIDAADAGENVCCELAPRCWGAGACVSVPTGK